MMDGMRQVNVRLGDELLTGVEKLADACGLSTADWIRRALRSYLKGRVVPAAKTAGTTGGGVPTTLKGTTAALALEVHAQGGWDLVRRVLAGALQKASPRRIDAEALAAEARIREQEAALCRRLAEIGGRRG